MLVVSEAEAVAKAIEKARFCGMKDDPTDYHVRYGTLRECCEVGACVGRDLETPVYVVWLRVDFESTCPGPLPHPLKLYTVILDAQTWSVIWTSDSYLAAESPFPVP